jgi:hypothetical protein
MPNEATERPVGRHVTGLGRGGDPPGRGGPPEPARGPLVLTPFRKSTPLPLSAPAAAVDRLRRAVNAVRDAQEMLERLVRTGPLAKRPTLQAAIEDLDWTAVALSTALLALQEPAPP